MCIDSPEMIRLVRSISPTLTTKRELEKKIKKQFTRDGKIKKPLEVVIRSYFSLSLLTGTVHFSEFRSHAFPDS